MDFSNEELKAKYNPEGSITRRIQDRMLEILQIIDSICQKHNITYWLSGGSMLGAVRHKGYIPWDDDLDIELLRDDFFKLLTILEKELPENLSLQWHTTDKNYFFCFAKVRDKNSRIKDLTGYDRIWKERGVWVDIFPLAKIPRTIHNLSVKTFGHTYKVLRTASDPLKAAKKVRFWAALNRYLIFPFLRFLSFFSFTKYYDFDLGIPYYQKSTISDYLPVKYVDFESVKAPIANDANNYLTIRYGDYMKLPDNPGAQCHNEKVEIW